MVKFLHTADWQFGMKARDVAAKGGDIRRVRLDTLGVAADVARDRGADFVLLAGDVFEDNQVDSQLVYDVLRQLERFSCPVYVLPGNHDHAGPGSVYERPAFASRARHVHLLLEPRAVREGAAVLLPAPIKSRTSSADPTAGLGDLSSEDGIRIGVAHGSLKIENKYKPDDFPIRLDAAAVERLDYLALGHWHSFYQPDARTVYSGTPETTKFGEKDSGTAAWVEIDSPGAVPRIERVSLGNLTWEQWDDAIDGNPQGLLDSWRNRVDALADPGRVLARLAPAGRAPADFRLQVEEFAAWARARLFYLDLRLAGLEPVLDAEAVRLAVASHPLLSGLLDDAERLEGGDLRQKLIAFAGDRSS
ncbi:MAG: DNA repair exonuclease, partial [Candidatus Sericytochromatia bacterium]|nr:DNA repair exonuclease [Candidatus Tanganyikabacteria bacterium]